MPRCYCCSSLAFNDCCAPLLNNTQQANSPEQLMRSRYSAFCTGNIQYLLDTAHNDYLQAEHYNSDNTTQALKETLENTQWVGLKVLFSDHNSVEFVAFFHDIHSGAPSHSAIPSQLHEHSRFVFENDRWLYLDGEIKGPIKISRNDSCYCGSGKKIKKCHPI